MLADPTIGEIFTGTAGIRKYFDNYFIGHGTQTSLVNLVAIDEDSVRLEVAFTGTFPGNRLAGMFELSFAGGKIIKARAD